MRRLLFIAALTMAGCASIDRPNITSSSQPSSLSDERIYAWTAGSAAAISIDQTKEKGNKVCVLSAAYARDGISSIGIDLAKTGIATAGINASQSQTSQILKNESAAATFLDIGMFHICMLSAQPKDELKGASLVESIKAVVDGAAKVSESSSQWAPIRITAANSTPDSATGSSATKSTGK